MFGSEISRRIILASERRGPQGWFGSWYGKRFGFPTPFGFRITIQCPRESIQRCILTDGAYEIGIMRALARLPMHGGLFLDIGANIGQYTLMMAQRGVTTHAFEPNPRLAAVLKANLMLNGLAENVEIHEIAVCDKAGTQPFYEAERNDDGSHSLIPGVDARSLKEYAVETCLLDGYSAIWTAGRVEVMKLDVEGVEAKVLDGARRLLAEHRPVVLLETGDRLADRVGESASAVIGRLDDCKYDVYRIDETEGMCGKVNEEVSGELANYIAFPKESVSELYKPIMDSLRSSQSK